MTGVENVTEPMRSAFAAQLSDRALNWLTSNAVITSEQRADAVAILQRISDAPREGEAQKLNTIML